jgi:hypothetical protein
MPGAKVIPNRPLVPTSSFGKKSTRIGSVSEVLTLSLPNAPPPQDKGFEYSAPILPNIFQTIIHAGLRVGGAGTNALLTDLFL